MHLKEKDQCLKIGPNELEKIGSDTKDKSPGKSFQLGPESDDDDEGGGYECSEYYAYEQKCIRTIRVGINESKIKAKVTGCTADLELDKCPTLKVDDFH